MQSIKKYFLDYQMFFKMFFSLLSSKPFYKNKWREI
mgnify:CR=1 FL=1